MSEARERITHTDLVPGKPGEGYVERETEYVRADLYDVLANQRDGWKEDAQRYATNAEFWKGKYESERALNAELVEALKAAVYG